MDVPAERFEELIGDLDAVIWEYQTGPAASAGYTFMSASAEHMLGHDPQQWIQDPDFWKIYIHPDDQVLVDEFYERIEQGAGHHRIEYRCFHRDGRELWNRDIVHVLPRPEGGTTVRGVCLDITEQKRAEQAVTEAETKYRSLVEQIPAITYVWESASDPRRSDHTYISPQIETVLGYSADEWIRDPDLWQRRIHPDDLDRVVEATARTDLTGEQYEAEYRMIHRDGSELWVRDEAHVVGWDGAIPRVWQGVMFDVTEQRRVEKERHTLLVRLVQAQEEERRRIAGDIHDDSVQKMAAVGLRLRSLRNRVSDPDALVALDQLEETVDKSIGRLRHLLFELRPPALDREGLATALHDYLAQTAEDSGFQAQLRNELPEEPPIELRAIAFRIAQEALTNVRKHAEANRVEVTLTLGEDGGFLTRINDDGRGFPRDMGGADPGHAGLSTMRERAELAGGWLGIESRAGLGTVVEFWLPLDADDAAPHWDRVHAPGANGWREPLKSQAALADVFGNGGPDERHD